MKVVDLFCGAGGFSHGFIKDSDRHLAVDIDQHALATYARNYPTATVWNRDIGRLHSSEIQESLGGRPEVVLASPPCEEFSKSNPESYRPAADRIYGTGTARLLLDAIRIIGDLEPQVFIIENVAAILRSGGHDIIVREFIRVGIKNIHFNLVRAHQHGNPSKRLRVFISNMKFKLPRRNPPTVHTAIGDLPPLGLDAILSRPVAIPNHNLVPVMESRMKKVRRARSGQGVRHFRISKSKTQANWVRLRPDQLATSINGLSRYIHPTEDRLLTVREHARLMSYPDSFVFTGPVESQYNQVGESVPPLISHLLAQEALEHIE
ncbi:MAG: DNA cytosine methyltransferase [Candidatus Thorarchaeota archaeon]